MGTVFLNGHFLPQASATISIMDRGFLFGDGIYEVVPVFAGKMLGFDQHIARLGRSLDAIKIKNIYSIEKWREICGNLLEKNQCADQSCNIYIQITRGAEQTRAHAIPENANPTIVAFITPAKIIPKEMLREGFSAITLEDSRRRDCHIKAINLLPNILLYNEAKLAGAFEAILLRGDFALEGTSSNLFIVKNNEIFTPPANHTILGGITRDLVLNLAKENHIAASEKDITRDMLFSADEIWLTGSSKEICPVTTLNQKPVGDGIVGPMWKIISELYEEYKNHDE